MSQGFFKSTLMCKTAHNNLLSQRTMSQGFFSSKFAQQNHPPLVRLPPVNHDSRASFWCLYCWLCTNFIICSSASIVNFEQVNAGWDGTWKIMTFCKNFAPYFVMKYSKKTLIMMKCNINEVYIIVRAASFRSSFRSVTMVFFKLPY